MSDEFVATLQVVKGASPATIRIRRFPAIIGRSSEASLRLGTTAVSRKHCEMYEEAGELLIRDLGSTNGTFLNNEKIEGSVRLVSDDLLRVGTVTFRAAVPQLEEAELAGEESCIDLGEEEAAPDDSAAGERSSVGYQETPDGSFITIEEEEVDDNEDEGEGVEELEAEATLEEAEEPVAKEAEEPAAKETEEVNPLAGIVEADEEPVQADDDDALGDFLKGLS